MPPNCWAQRACQYFWRIMPTAGNKPATTRIMAAAAATTSPQLRKKGMRIVTPRDRSARIRAKTFSTTDAFSAEVDRLKNEPSAATKRSQLSLLPTDAASRRRRRRGG